MSDFNEQVIADLRANGGQTPQTLPGRPILLLHSIGAKSGEKRVQPLMFLEQDGAWYIFASFGGAPNNPAWFHNLLANPEVEIEVGDGSAVKTVPVKAQVIEGSDREAIYREMAAQWPQFADYEQKTSRNVIPVVQLSRR